MVQRTNKYAENKPPISIGIFILEKIPEICIFYFSHFAEINRWFNYLRNTVISGKCSNSRQYRFGYIQRRLRLYYDQIRYQFINSIL